MAEYDKGRLFWIKLTDRFMGSDTVDFLMTQKDGANYIVLYQMLCLKTVNNGGVLGRTLGEMLIPYDAEKIQRDCKWFSIDTVRVALDLYRRLGLIYENRDGVLAIADFDRLIGSQTYGAAKKEEQKRRSIEGGKKVENFPPEKDKEKEQENTTTSSTFSVGARAREDGLCRRDGLIGKGVLYLSDNQYNSLLVKLGIEMFQYYADKLCAFIEDTGATVKNHYATILKWYDEDCACDAAPSPEEVQAVYQDREEMVRAIIEKRKCEEDKG